MPKKTRKFIDRKRDNPVTFRLVSRSQHDPLVADENAPQKVLLEVDSNAKSKNDKSKSHIEELQKYGIFFDDDYNYLQHLKESENTMEWERIDKDHKDDIPKLNLPSSVFESSVKEDVGLLNKAAPHTGLRLDIDPDIVAAMDDDFDYSDPENQLEDNFLELANVENSSEASDEYSTTSDGYSDEERDEVLSLDDEKTNGKATKSRFTEYSVSSSVLKRNEHLMLLDARFDKLMEEYDSTQIGALDGEDIEGHLSLDSPMLMQCIEEFEKAKQMNHQKYENLAEKLHENYDEGNCSSSEEEFDLIQVPQKKEFDCQSILSTYSNTQNIPKLIEAPKVQKKIRIDKKGMPIDDFGPQKLTPRLLSNFDKLNETVVKLGTKSVGEKSIISTLSTLSIRPKGETPEERKDRKKSLKEYRKVRRIERKINSLTFKEEALKREKIDLINARNNLHKVRLQ